MNHDDLAKEYRAFFIESQAGTHFMSEIDRLIKDAHEKAEQDAEHSRDYTQMARSLRAIKTHVVSVTTDIKKKGKAPKA